MPDKGRFTHFRELLEEREAVSVNDTTLSSSIGGDPQSMMEASLY